MVQIKVATYITALNEVRGNRYISPQIEGLLGFSSTTWLADPGLWIKQVHPNDRRRVLTEIYRTNDNGKSFRTEYRLMAHDGHIVWVRDEAVIVQDETGKPCFIKGVIFDISELLRAEEALQKSEAKFRMIFDANPVGIALVDKNGRLMEINLALHEMLGYNREDLRNKAFTELIHPEDATLDTEVYKKLLAGKCDHYQIERRYIRKDKGVVWGRLKVSLIRNGEGAPQFTIHMVEDITEQKRLETQFLQSQKMETVGRLAGGIAHDLNNLFTVLSGYAQLSLMGLSHDNPLRGNIEQIKKATERATELTHQLLAFLRRQILGMKVLDLNALVRGLEKMLSRVIGEDIDLIMILAENLGRVKTDPGQIEQVILNLVVNARDAMPNGGKLILETDNVEFIEESIHSHIDVIPGRYVTLLVSDTGSGMSPEVKERIFDPFFTTKIKGKGTGLGLSTVYNIVKQSGGHIGVYSELGQGTTLKIYLPRVEGEADALPSQEEISDLPKGSETVLLVEDEHTVRALAARVLRDQGYTVLEATDGHQAIHIAQSHVEKKIHLLLTDVVMPQMGGKELVERIKSLYPDINVLFISGYTDHILTHHVVFDPGAMFMQKPFSPTALIKKVQEVLNGR